MSNVQSDEDVATSGPPPDKFKEDERISEDSVETMDPSLVRDSTEEGTISVATSL